MGLRLRLRPDTDLDELGPQARVVAEAMQRHGVIVADNGSAWFISGVPDERWDNDDLRTLGSLSGDDFEAVEASSLMVDPDSGRIATAASEEVADARVWGGPRTGRIETSVAISQLAFPDGALTAVLARSDGFADALAAGPLATSWHAPVLLTSSDALSPPAASELDRLGTREVVLAGGVAAIGQAVADELEARGFDVTRLGGTDRFATASELARAAVSRWRRAGDHAAGGHVLLALGAHPDPTAAWPDALAGSAAGATLHRPVLLARSAALPEQTWSSLRELGTTHVTLVGGPAAIATEVEDELREAGLSTTRLAGGDRYATAVEVARHLLAAGRGATAVLAATGGDFPDALAAGPATVVLDAHLLLTRPSAVPAVVADHLRALAPIDVAVAGGPAAVDDATVADLLHHAGASP
jgi:putative cell wall-binding protein